MEEKYMIEIHAVYGLKKNQNLTAAEHQELVLEILHRFRKQAEEWGKHKLKKEIIKSIGDTVDEIFTDDK